MRDITVTFGETEYTIKQQRYGQARAWRGQLAQAIEPILGILNGQLSGAIGQAQSIMVPESLDEARSFDWQPMAGAVGNVTGLISEVSRAAVGSLDIAADLLFAYDPDLARQRETIEAEAYDDQIVGALIEVVKLAYPIQPAIRALSMAGTG